MNYEINPEDQKRAAAFAAFCRETILPQAGLLDEAGGRNQALLEENLRLLAGYDLWREFPAARPVTQVLMGEELAKCCGATFLGAYLRDLAAGFLKKFAPGPSPGDQGDKTNQAEEQGAIGLYETDLERFKEDINSLAVATPSGWLLSGRKMMVIGAMQADFFLVLARKEDLLAGGEGFFRVARAAAGVTVSPSSLGAGLRGVSVGEVTFHQVLVARQEEISSMEEGQEAACLKQWLENRLRLGAAILGIGLGVAVMEAVITYAKTTMARGRPLGLMENVGAKIASMYALNDLGRLLTLKAAWSLAKDENKAADLTGAAKIFTCESAREIAQLALMIQGAGGFSPGTLGERLFRDSQVPAFLFSTPELVRSEIAANCLNRFRS
jgi:alkylation response protein AidB-like acyl-CoA dehydrogenase